MGKEHELWKAAKAKAALVDTKALFNLKLGDALDKWEDKWGAVHPPIVAKENAKTLKQAELAAAIKLMEPLVNKVVDVYEKYQKRIVDAAKKNNEQMPKLKDQKKQQQAKERTQQYLALSNALARYRKSVYVDCMMGLKTATDTFD